ncbi:Stress response protein YsnF [Corallococcus coralloides]|uniref:Stress response protein YsnF n=1 Tax=Corallococcus coralloides TaxID=184914 RepID=A0A410S2J9_CORCK|nr:YsnF/AvaK domain-containing protein [Corallococcus coralloides]QAT88429.1 Stress response protein YsnF [Corallococcus coralloides]
MMIKRNDIKEGMTVRSSDGEKLGKVFAVSEGEFHIEKGMFFPKDYLVRYAEVSDIRNGEIYLNHGREALRGLSDSGAVGATAATATGGTVGGIGAGLKTGAAKVDVARTGAEKVNIKDRELKERDLRTDMRAAERIANEDVTLRTHHEELDVTKRQRSAGEAQVRKIVVEETKTVEVPLRHEEVEVVRRAVKGKDTIPGDVATFQEETIRIPLSAEEAELTKRAYTDEEITIHKRPIEERRSMEGRVRHEELEDVKVVRTEPIVDEEKRRTGYRTDADIDPLKRS